MADSEYGDLIELRVEKIAQLFQTLDPFPFRERDLDTEAEEFIVGWARELPAGRAIKILVHLPEAETKTRAAGELREAFRRFFSDRAIAVQSEIKELFRIGRRSLWIGISILVACLLAAHLAAGYLIESPFRRLVEESFVILGWVANWRPLEIFLYDWLPLVRKRDLYRRLAAAKLDLKPYPAQKTSESLARHNLDATVTVSPSHPSATVSAKTESEGAVWPTSFLSPRPE